MKKSDCVLCPYCGMHYPVAIMSDIAENFPVTYYIQCGCCRAQGPESDSMEGAVELWNARQEKCLCCSQIEEYISQAFELVQGGQPADAESCLYQLLRDWFPNNATLKDYE